MVRSIASLILIVVLAGCKREAPGIGLPVGAQDLPLRSDLRFIQMPQYEDLEVYKAAAYSGSGQAANALATFYMKADKTGKLEFYWTLVAAENGDPVGQYNAGLMYMDPSSGAKSLGRARFWLGKAAAQGHDRASKRLIEINSIRRLDRAR